MRRVWCGPFVTVLFYFLTVGNSRNQDDSSLQTNHETSLDKCAGSGGMVGEFDLPAKDWAKDKMTRSISTLLMVLVPCVLVYAGPARAQYLPPPNAAQSPAG